MVALPMLPEPEMVFLTLVSVPVPPMMLPAKFERMTFPVVPVSVVLPLILRVPAPLPSPTFIVPLFVAVPTVVRFRVALGPMVKVPLLTSVATFITSVLLLKTPSWVLAPELLVNVPVTVSVLEPPSAPALVKRPPELVRLPDTVMLVDESKARKPVLLMVNVPMPGVSVNVWPFPTVREPSTLPRFASPLAVPAFSVPFTTRFEPATISVIPFGWLVRLSVAPLFISRNPLLTRVATFITSVLLLKTPRVVLAPELLVNVPVTVSVLVPPSAPALVNRLPELVRLPDTVMLVDDSKSRRPVLLMIKVPVPGVSVNVWPFPTVREPSTLPRFASPLAVPAFSVPFTTRVEPATISVIPLGWLVRFSVAPLFICRNPLLTRVATFITSALLVKTPRVVLAPELLVNVPVTVSVLVPPSAPALVKRPPELARLPDTVVLVDDSKSSRPVLLMVKVPVPGVSVKVWPFPTVREPSTLPRFASPLAVPAFSVPLTTRFEPATTSVIPFGWLVKFNVAPES